MTDTIHISEQSIKHFQNISSELNWKDWLDLVAVFLSGIVAVSMGQLLQNHKSKNDRIYQNKFMIFATILGLRHAKGYNEQFVIAINQIPIVFNQDNDVLVRLEQYINTHNKSIPADNSNIAKTTYVNELNSDLNNLVVAMANVLGYNNINNIVMKNFFYPQASELRYEAERITAENIYNQKSQSTSPSAPAGSSNENYPNPK